MRGNSLRERPTTADIVTPESLRVPPRSSQSRRNQNMICAPLNWWYNQAAFVEETCGLYFERLGRFCATKPIRVIIGERHHIHVQIPDPNSKPHLIPLTRECIRAHMHASTRTNTPTHDSECPPTHPPTRPPLMCVRACRPILHSLIRVHLCMFGGFCVCECDYGRREALDPGPV